MATRAQREQEQNKAAVEATDTDLVAVPEPVEETETVTLSDGESQVRVADLVENAAVADPFADLDEAVEVAEFTRGPSMIDYEAITPPRVKGDLARSFEKYKPAVDSEGNEIPGKTGTAAWMTQKFTSVEQALAYEKFAINYAKFRGWTFRKSWMTETSEGTLVTSKDKAPSKVLRFCAKPKEVRARS